MVWIWAATSSLGGTNTTVLMPRALPAASTPFSTLDQYGFTDLPMTTT